MRSEPVARGTLELRPFVSCVSAKSRSQLQPDSFAGVPREFDAMVARRGGDNRPATRRSDFVRGDDCVIYLKRVRLRWEPKVENIVLSATECHAVANPSR